MCIKNREEVIKRSRKISDENNIVLNKDLINLYNVKNTSINYRDKFSANPIIIILDIFIFYILLYITILVDSKTDEKFTLQIFSVGLLLFIAYAFFTIYNSAKCINEKDYKNLVENLNASIDKKINENYSDNLNGDINDLVNFRERKLKFIDECAQPVNKSKDIFTGILATSLGTILLATLKLLLNKWHVIDIRSGIDFLSGIYLVTLLLLVSVHIILSLSDVKFKLLYQRALSEIKLDTI